MFWLVDKFEVFNDGRHNAFTDLKFFNDRFFLSFRNAADHISYDGKIMLSHSKDGIDWSKPEVLMDTETDDRDPKLFPFQGKLFCTVQTRRKDGEEPHRRRPLVSSSADGFNWSRPVSYFKEDYVPWRPKVNNGVLYNTLYRYHRQDPALWQVVLVKSNDGLNWDYISTVYKGDSANETELHFCDDGILMATVRRERMTTVVAASKFPYTKWDYEEMDDAVHAPCIRKVNEKLVLVGREYTSRGAGVSLWIYDGSRFVKELEIEKIADQDCSYCGLEVNQKGQGLLSYYKGTGSRANIWVGILESKL
jgi:hypothetical protein